MSSHIKSRYFHTCFSLTTPKVQKEPNKGRTASFKLRRRKSRGKEETMETIISACISAGVTLIVCLISNHGQQEKTRALVEYKLEELTKRVDKHNNTIERTFDLERRMDVQEEQIKVANHRIEDLERRGD